MISAATLSDAFFTPSPRHEPLLTVGNGLLLLFDSQGQIYVAKTGNELSFPSLVSFPEHAAAAIYCGTFDAMPCYAGEAGDEVLTNGLTPVGMREVLLTVSPGVYEAVARGAELVHWRKSRRFCGGCGGALEYSLHDMSLGCPSCQTVSYPVIAPAIIVAVMRNDRLLLAANKRFPPSLYSLVAGFVECGETLENAVRRELREEVGIEVDRIKYFDSQAWPFPSSLMVGFTAEYVSGELRPDGEEIIAAEWFSIDRLPQLPRHGSISRALIDAMLTRER